MAGKAGTRKRNRTKRVREQPPRDWITYSQLEKERLRDFVYFALGDPKMTPFEANFINGMKLRLQFDPMYISRKQTAILEQIKEKLHYNNPESSDNVETDYLDMEIDEYGRSGIEAKYDNGFGDDEADGIEIVRELRS
jgi:hypothetical protein